MWRDLRQDVRYALRTFVTASYFDVLGVRMRVGRPFTVAEDNPSGATPVAVVSDRLWASMFAIPRRCSGRS